MAERDWLRPAVPVEAAGTAWRARGEAAFELRPLSLGEVLDRTFALYRSRFLLFALISMIAAAVQVIAQAVSMASAQTMLERGGAHPAPGIAGALANLRMVGAMSLKAYAVLLVFFLVSAVTQAATALAVTQVYQGHAATARDALRAVAPRWGRWIGIALWQLGSFVWVPLAAAVPAVVLGVVAAQNKAGSAGLFFVVGLLMLLVLAAFPVGFILYLRNGLAIPAAVMEGLAIRPAMRRSKVLAAGAKARIFVVLLIAGVLLEVVGILQTPLSVLLLIRPHQAHYVARGLALLITFVGHTVVAPVALIGLTLVYFDQRVRKEAFDLELLLQQAGEAPAAAGDMLPGEPVVGYAPER